jgi:hypothetical protein
MRKEIAMADDSKQQQRVRERAFQIWIEEGQPEGKDREHWERAEKEVTGSGDEIKPGETIGEIKYAAAGSEAPLQPSQSQEQSHERQQHRQ